MKIINLEYKTVPSKYTNSYIELSLEFFVNKDDDYYCVFEALTTDKINPQLSIKGTNFYFHSYLEDCKTVRGAIADLEDLQNNVELNSMFDSITRLKRCLNTLISFWH